MFDTPDYEQSDSNTLSKKHKKHNIEHLDVYVYSFDQSLNLDTDESYTLTVSPKRHFTPLIWNSAHVECHPLHIHTQPGKALTHHMYN